MKPKLAYRSLAGLCAVAVAFSLSIVPASAAFPGANGKLAFGTAGGANNVYTVWANGTGLKLAIRNAESPAWSPDGERIAFQRRGADGFFHIWVKDMVTGSLSQITSNRRSDEFPAWSPDGAKIAFVTFLPGTGAWGGIYYIKSTRPFGSRQLVLASKPLNWAYDLAWSPDGTKIAFSYYVDGAGTNIAVTKVGSPYATPSILTSDGYDEAPTWSPTGRKIAYSAGWLSVMNADGTDQTHFANSESSIYSLAWSPDGRKIAAIIDWEYTTMIITLNPSTGAWIDQYIASGVNGGVDWQPIIL
jgi:Tol biopolymer transport system component